MCMDKGNERRPKTSGGGAVYVNEGKGNVVGGWPIWSHLSGSKRLKASCCFKGDWPLARSLSPLLTST